MGEDKGRLEPGTLLDNRYEVVRPLATGGMATIYLVRHLGLESLHALKVPDPSLFHHPEARQRFTTEGRLQALLRHPHIVQVTDIVISPVPGLVMEYVEGGTLDELRERLPGGRVELPLLKELFLPVLDAMAEAHGHRVVHRDLTPRNILVVRGQQGRLHPKVTDFGIAKVSQDTPDQKYRTRTGALLGTRPYMSPEQIRGATEVDARTDIFALGAILYEVVTGRVAFDADNDFELMKRITEGTYPPPEQVLPELPEGLRQCIRQALAVDPAERFQDCGAFRAALERALEPPRPEAPPPRPEALAPPPPPSAPANRRVSALWLVPLGVLAGGLGVERQEMARTLRGAREENARLRSSEQAERRDTQRLRTELDTALGQARRSETQSRSLQAGNEETLQRLQLAEQRVQELQGARTQVLTVLENTLTDTTLHNKLEGHSAFRVCNRTSELLKLQYLDDVGNWSALVVLDVQACDTQWMHGPRARVPVLFSSVRGGSSTATQGELLAGVVVGRMPDLDADWRPWDNQIVSTSPQGFEVKSTYLGSALLGGARSEP